MASRRPAPPHFRQRESVRAGLLRIASSVAPPPRRDTLSDLGVSKAIHQTRVALKRQRAWLRLLRPTLEPGLPDRLGRRLRLAGRRLAGARDAVVARDTLKDLAARRRTTETESAALDRIHRRVTRAVTDPKLPSAETQRSIAHAESCLRSTGVALSKASWRKRGWSILGAGIRISYRRARRRLRIVRKSTDASAFHAWRTASKSLLYQVQILLPCAGRRTQRWIADLDHFQSALGDLNDLDVLGKHLASNPRRFGKKSDVVQLLALLHAEEERRRKAVLSAGKRLFSERTADLVGRLEREWKDWRGK
ncbi:MAG: CHAD domain-containing protein [Limisphaerales bacterium]